MKTTAILALIAVLGGGSTGYLVVRHQAERAAWQEQSRRLSGRVADLERLADERLRALSLRDEGAQTGQALRAATARLADIEARVLDGSARLAELESDRIVAEDRAGAALATLRDQVRSITEIEADLGRLGTRRLDLQTRIMVAERHLAAATDQIGERRAKVAALDRRIADLAMRRETAAARLGVTREALDARTAALAAQDSAPQPPAGEAAGPAPPVQPSSSAPESSSIVAAVQARADDRQDQGRGLYRFKRLAVEPAASPIAEQEVATADPRAPAGAGDERARSERWAEEQYRMGVTLVDAAERSSGTRELNEAVLAFKAALGEWPKRQDPLRWAAAQNDLAYALALLGQRESSVPRLEAAALACREALAEFTPDGTPLLWAAAQHNLGVTLSGLAAVTDDEIIWRNAIEALQQSVAAYGGAGAAAEAARAERRLREAHDHLTARGAVSGSE